MYRAFAGSDRPDRLCKELEAEGTEEARARIENIDELINKAASYEEDAQEPSLEGFLSEVALVADIDSMDDDAGRVILMTLHSAKGLEFPQVYLTGMEDGPFKLYVGGFGGSGCSGRGGDFAMSASQRAMQDLTPDTCEKAYDARRNTLQPSVRFLNELPEELLKKEKREEPKEQEPEPRVPDLFHAGQRAFFRQRLMTVCLI